MDLISSSSSEIRATIDLGAHPGAEEAMGALLGSLLRICDPSVRRDVACVSLVGSGITGELHRLGGTWELLGDVPVHLVSHAANDAHVSYVIDESAASELERRLHDKLFGAAARSAELGPTWREIHAAPSPRVIELPNGDAEPSRDIPARAAQG
jgi:aspartokinase